MYSKEYKSTKVSFNRLSQWYNKCSTIIFFPIGRDEWFPSPIRVTPLFYKVIHEFSLLFFVTVFVLLFLQERGTRDSSLNEDRTLNFLPLHFILCFSYTLHELVSWSEIVSCVEVVVGSCQCCTCIALLVVACGWTLRYVPFAIAVLLFASAPATSYLAEFV